MNRPLSILLPMVAGALALAAACTGKISKSKGETETGMPDAQGNLPYAPPQPAAAALPARAWRLTHAEYRKSVKDVTGIDFDTSGFEAEADGGLFVNLSNVNFVPVSYTHLRAHE